MDSPDWRGAAEQLKQLRQRLADLIAEAHPDAIDRQATRMAEELLSDPVFKAQMQALLREAFCRALQSLTERQP
jgi:uncharacterized protein YejL (UPF0352 family)